MHLIPSIAEKGRAPGWRVKRRIHTNPKEKKKKKKKKKRKKKKRRNTKKASHSQARQAPVSGAMSIIDYGHRNRIAVPVGNADHAMVEPRVCPQQMGSPGLARAWLLEPKQNGPKLVVP